MTSPIAAADIPPEWIEMIREIAAKGSYEFRASPEKNRIEARNHLQNRWHTLMLYSSTYDFVSTEDRARVLELLK